ncbi:hypothetical protein KSP39_PZI006373 [Platanthera zijinensis]|uniref:RNase H type-1 domain-containing protein n=1 Tax=Platanthera zijinensis TaxID=2320716 RepID=A0AAP0BPE9_9ASPA
MQLKSNLAQEKAPARWTLYIDGALGAEGTGAGLLLISPEKVTLEYGLRFRFPATNNVAEYEALIAGLRLATDCKVESLTIYVDSQIVVSQVEGEYEAKNDQLAQYLALAKSLLAKIPSHQVIHIPREQNTQADSLSKLATSSASYQSRRRRVEDIMTPSSQGPWEVSMIDGKQTSWMTPIREYLEHRQLPDDRVEARRLQIRAATFAIIDGELYKRAFSGPYLKCLPAS